MALSARYRIYAKNLIFIRFQLFVLAFIFFLSISSVFATDYWPKDKWRTATPESQGMSSEILADMMDILWQKNHEIDSILIVRNGYVVLDTYHSPRVPILNTIYTHVPKVYLQLSSVSQSIKDISNQSISRCLIFSRRKPPKIRTSVKIKSP